MIHKKEITREIAADWLSGRNGESLFLFSSGGSPEFKVTNEAGEYIAAYPCPGVENIDWDMLLREDDEYVNDNCIVVDGKKVDAYEFFLICYESDANLFDEFVEMIGEEVNIIDCPCWENPEYQIKSQDEFTKFLEEEECGTYVKYFDLDQNAKAYRIETEKEQLEQI